MEKCIFTVWSSGILQATMCCNVRLNASVLQCIPISEMQFYFKILLVLLLLLYFHFMRHFIDLCSLRSITNWYSNPTLKNNINLIQFSLIKETWKRERVTRLINKLLFIKVELPNSFGILPFRDFIIISREHPLADSFSNSLPITRNRHQKSRY